MNLEDSVKRARKQLLIGNVVAIIVAIAVLNSLANPNSSRIWIGGFLVSVLFYYRGLRTYLALFRHQRSLQMASSLSMPIDFGIILMSIALVIAGSAVVMPEYFKVSSPTVGTCWISVKGTMRPVACWSDNAKFQTISIATSAELCDDEVFILNFKDNQFHCLALHEDLRSMLP